MSDGTLTSLSSILTTPVDLRFGFLRRLMACKVGFGDDEGDGEGDLRFSFPSGTELRKAVKFVTTIDTSADHIKYSA